MVEHGNERHPMPLFAHLLDPDSLVWALAQNAALLIALAYVHSLFPVTADSARFTRFAREAGLGLVLGLLGIAIIAVAYTFEPGVVFDTRSILIGLTGLFFGAIPTVIVMALTAAFRLWQGGLAAPVGVAVILASGLIGLGWRHVRKPDLKTITWSELLLFGLAVHLVMIGIFAALPVLFPGHALAAVTIPVLCIYPVATAVLGRLLSASFQNRANDERLQLILKGANDGWWDWDLVKNILIYSPRWWQMLGLEPGAFPAHADLWRELMHPDDLERVNRRFEAVLAAGEKQYEVEFRLRHREGHYISVISRGYIQHDAKGKAVRVSGTNVDITPLRRALDEANAAKFWLDAAGRIARIGYWELQFDGFRPMWSDITCDIHDEPRGFVPAFDRALSYYPGEYRDAIARDLENLRLHGRPYLSEYQIITAKGRRIWVQSRGEPIHDSENRIIGARGVFQDIDAQKRAAEALLQSERNYREVFDATADAIFIQDEATGRILDVNAAMLRMYGFTDKASALACTLDDLSLGESPYSADDARLHIRATLENGPQIFEWKARRTDGATFWVEVSLRRSEIGGQGRLLACCRDISRRKALETRVREAEKMESLGRLAGGIAHDFNNMLGVIIGHTDLAEVRLDSGKCPRSDLLQIRSAAQRSAALVRQLLTFARQQETTPAVIDLNHSVDAALSLLRRLIGENITLDWRPGAALWPVRVDPVQIDQILTNLAVNARDAMGESGVITVRTANVPSDAAERVLLEFTDAGSGMDAETLRHVFEPFFTTKAVGKGTGLGLATVYGIVKQNNGVIEVDSHPGRGTTFRIFFPRVADAALSRAEGSAHPLPPARGHETILLVEDEPAILKLATLILELNGYKIVTSSTPEAALEYVTADDGPLHLVISDVIMPGLNGGALREQILMLRPGLKFLFISGYSGDALGGLDLTGPGIGFLHKPFSADVLARKVRALLDA